MVELKRLGPNVAQVEVGDRTILFSYDTPVCVRIGDGWHYVTTKYWSRTTTGHVKKWLAGAVAKPISQEAFDLLVAGQEVNAA